MIHESTEQLLQALKGNMEITSNFNYLGFHDASIESVNRHSDTLEVLFDFVIVAPEHPDANGTVIELRNVKASFNHVSSEKALIWHDDKAPIQHPNPEAPVNEVMHGTQKDDYFHFDGFWQPDDWSEWYIYATGFIVSGKQTEFNRVAF